MREIKFRAWDSLRKEMDSWKDILSSDMGIHFVLEGTSNNRWIPMQFTGLKDENDEDIYEGDIVQCGDVNDKSCDSDFLRGVIIFKESAWQIEYKLITGDKEMGILGQGYDYEESEFEVIGNIYENSDLLKEG